MAGGRPGDRSADHSWPGRGRAARRDHPPDNRGMGADARPAGFVLRPLSRRAIRLIRQRHRRSVCRSPRCWARSSTCHSASISGPIWSAPAIGRRSVSLTSRSISSPSDWRCCRPIGFVGSQQRADEPVPNAGRPDLDPCLHRLVELPDRTRPEQHHGLRAMTSVAPVPQVRLCVRVCVRDTLRDRAQTRSRAVHRLSHDGRRASGHAPFARHRRPVDGELSTRDVLVRLDCDGRVGSAHIRPRRRTLARALVATVLVGVVVGDSRGSDDWVRLPHAALVSTLVTNVS